MADLFSRFASVILDETKIEGLRVVFKVERSLKIAPNTLDLSVYNLSEATRKKIQNNTGALVQIVAGYANESGLIYSGEPTIINHTRTGPDWITKISGGDGGKATRQARTVKTFSSNARMIDVAKELAGATGLGRGNFDSVIAAGNIRSPNQTFGKGYAVSGLAVAELEKIVRMMGYELSIQNGALQLLALDAHVEHFDVVLTPLTGLVGSPEVGEKGTVKAKALLNHRFVPGGRVLLSSKALNGNFRIEKVSFDGDTHDQAWYATLEMRAVKNG